MREKLSIVWSMRDEHGEKVGEQRGVGLRGRLTAALLVTSVSWGLALFHLLLGNEGLLLSHAWLKLLGLGFVISVFMHLYLKGLFGWEGNRPGETVLLVLVSGAAILHLGRLRGSAGQVTFYFMLGSVGFLAFLVFRVLAGAILAVLVSLRRDKERGTLTVTKGARRHRLQFERVRGLERRSMEERDYLHESSKELLGDRDTESSGEEDACTLHQLRLVLDSGEFVVIEEFLHSEEGYSPSYPLTGPILKEAAIQSRFAELAEHLDIPLVEAEAGNGVHPSKASR